MATCAVLPRGFGSLGATPEPFEDKVCGPGAARDARPSSLTQTLAARAHLLHPQVLRPGRAESGAFRSTPALHMIGAKACSVVSIFSAETYDTHILIMEINLQPRDTHAPVQILRHTCLSCLASGPVIESDRLY